MAVRSKKALLFEARLDDKTREKLDKIVNRFRTLSGDAELVNQRIRNMEQALRPVTSQLDKISNRFKAISAFTFKGLTLPAAGIGIAGVKFSADSQRALNSIKVLAKLDDVKAAPLEKEADRIGKATQFSKGDVLNTMSVIASQGVEDPKKIIALTDPIMDLTGAARIKPATRDMPLEQTADILASVMNAFKMDPGKDAKRVADAVAHAITTSPLNLVEYGEFIKNAGSSSNMALARDAFETSLGAAKQLSRYNVKGPEAGTAFGSGMNRLIAPPKEARDAMKALGMNPASIKDKDGKLKNINAVFEYFEKVKAMPEQIMAVLGADAGKYLSILASTSQYWEETVGELRNSAALSGTAKRLNDSSMEDFWGEVDKLKGAFEGVLERVGSSGLLGQATRIVEKLGSVLDKIEDMKPENFERLVMISKVLASVSVAAAGFAGVAKLGKVFTAASAAMGAATAVSSALGTASALGLVAGAFGIYKGVDYFLSEESNTPVPTKIPVPFPVYGPVEKSTLASDLAHWRAMPEKTMTLNLRNVPQGSYLTGGNDPFFKLNVHYAP